MTSALDRIGASNKWAGCAANAPAPTPRTEVSMPAKGTRKTTHERFWAKVDKREDGCWEWTGTKGGKCRPGEKPAYGRFYVDEERRLVPAHRWAYEERFGEVRPGIDMDHLCRNPSCVNPDHLEPVSHAENLRRAFGVTEEHCSRGHRWADGDNTYIDPNGFRRCRSCQRERRRESERRLRAVA